ncbi:MAG: 1-(5-phosphoribosyl)-5-[(5-phosphoribosylamino)methylideneamino]imidazole-4-carboxamide isomerase [Bernardetiaceae bacterium]|nr:1-(5-phosphoribosyl)-5-[(5-phosphoribosylamino)methylideneamino]imidazole-4-carboxamide isomerase [Bernardetiaceae bacterium]
MFEIIPAIDIINGECVRLIEGDYARKTVYEDSPLMRAKQFESYGFKRLHIVDLDGAKAAEPLQAHILKEISEQTDMIIDYGGGIQDANDVDMLLEAGATMVSIGSLATKKPTLFGGLLSSFGGDKILLAADVRDNKIAFNAWRERSRFSVFEIIEKFIPAGLSQFFCTDVQRDGRLEGINEKLYTDLRKAFPNIKIIASGGVSNINDIKLLQDIGIDGVIVGKAFYENRVQPEEALALLK